MAKKEKRKHSIRDRGYLTREGSWEVTFTDGTKVNTGYYPNPRMAVGKALSKNRGKKVKSVRYKKR